jgi:hypothetical protein
MSTAGRFDLRLVSATVRNGIPVTTATRTVWDLATTFTPLRTRRAFEQAEKLGPERMSAAIT